MYDCVDDLSQDRISLFKVQMLRVKVHDKLEQWVIKRLRTRTLLTPHARARVLLPVA